MLGLVWPSDNNNNNLHWFGSGLDLGLDLWYGMVWYGKFDQIRWRAQKKKAGKMQVK